MNNVLIYNTSSVFLWCLYIYIVVADDDDDSLPSNKCSSKYIIIMCV